MSRPKPKTLLQYTGKKNYKMEEVLEAIAIYAVFYQGNPINLKSSSIISNYPGPKYKKVSFSRNENQIVSEKNTNQIINKQLINMSTNLNSVSNTDVPEYLIINQIKSSSLYSIEFLRQQ